MTLRTRLTLWLVLLSVVPLGAVTVYSYVSSANALRDAAAREADLLAGELRSRMQLVTAELSARMEKLVTDPGTTRKTQVAKTAAVQTAAQPAGEPATKPVTKAAPVAPAAPAVPEPTVDAQVAEALGDAAVLLNSVELHGVRNLYRMATAGAATNDPARGGGGGVKRRGERDNSGEKSAHNFLKSEADISSAASALANISSDQNGGAGRGPAAVPSSRPSTTRPGSAAPRRTP